MPEAADAALDIRDQVEPDELRAAIQSLGEFILFTASPDRADRLFPADPLVYVSNPLSLGFGAAGVLWSLNQCGFDLPEPLTTWFETRLGKASPRDLPPGLLTGLAGIAWVAWDLGYHDAALELLGAAIDHDLSLVTHSHFLGMAGIGTACLRFSSLTRDPTFVEAAVNIGERLLESAKNGPTGVHWEDVRGRTPVGFGYGASGVAVFLHHLFKRSGDSRFATAARKAAAFDLARAVPLGPMSQGVSFPGAVDNDPTLECYLESGSAGILRALTEMEMLAQAPDLLPDLHRKYSVCAGLLFGLAGVADSLLTAHWASADPRYREIAGRPIAGIRLMYLIPTARGLAVPGDGLARFSCDYASGSAGAMRVLQRYLKPGPPDFSLMTSRDGAVR